MGCTMSKKTGRKGKTSNNENNHVKQTVTSADEEGNMFQNMKRAQLQKLCKQFGLKASGKNTELISRLQEHQKNAITSNNNNTNVEEQPLSPKSSTAGEEHEKQYLDNVTFEIIDSQIPADEHVHVRGEDKFLTRINNDIEKLSKQTRACDIPDSTSETNVQETADSKIEPASRGVLRELNNDDAREAEAQPNKAKINACTKWCVVEGLFKQENKALWRRIHLLGGKPMISNSFGKRVPFVLEPCGLTTPDNCDDNYICGTCVRDNETSLRWQGSSRVVHSSVTPQDVVNLESEVGVTCSTPTSSNHSLLTSFSRVGSVKRKRNDDKNSSLANSSADSDQMEKKRRTENVVRSAGNTPASPQVRKARGEQLVLPRNLQKPWRPKKTTKTAQASTKEDTDFAKRVEEIIKNTQPGSEEEMLMIMKSTSSKIQRSPTKHS